MQKKEVLPIRVTGSNGISLGFRKRKNAEKYVALKKSYHKNQGENVIYIIIEGKGQGCTDY